MRGLDETWQADLVEMIPYVTKNKGYKYLLTVIDIFSKYAWAVPIKTKTGKDVASAMKYIINNGRIPRKLHVDRGKEFYNKEFKLLMKQHDIELYSTFSNLKASICERFNRTLKNKMWKQFSLRGTYKWFDILPDLIREYNETKHRTIKMKPKDVTKMNEKDLLQTVYEQHQIVEREQSPKFKIGEKVRISKYKHMFEKGYTPNWTTEVFTIKTVLKTIKYPDVYLIEKVLRRRGNKCYVKWLGFDSSHNSWINKEDL